MDRSTVARDLTPLISAGLVAAAEGADRRQRVVEVTADGRRLVVRARPRWRRVQADVRADVGGGEVDKLLASLRGLLATT